jgi:hypothetical protein
VTPAPWCPPGPVRSRRGCVLESRTRCLGAMALVKPAAFVQWHCQGFRLIWHWRAKSGRPAVAREIRMPVRHMSRVFSLWYATRIHGELPRLGIEISQATVAKYKVRKRGTPSPVRTHGSFRRTKPVADEFRRPL